MNVLKAVRQVLEEAGEALHVKVITERIIKAGLWETTGKTPQTTVSTMLYADINKRGEQSAFKKVARATFSLHTERVVASSVLNKEMGEAIRTEDPTLYNAPPNGKPMPFLEAAEKVLEFYGKEQPLHYGYITQLARDHGWLDTRGKTPEATMNASLSMELKRTRVRGGTRRFFRSAPGYYGLVKWIEPGLVDEGVDHNREVRKQLLSQLCCCTLGYFQEIVGRLLVEMGFESLEETPHSTGDGVDVRGSLQVSDVIRVKMVVFAKSCKNMIQRSTVDQVRKKLGVHEQGLIITTSDFSVAAIKAANRPKKAPVALMNGETLVGLLLEYNIGVRRITYDLFELEKVMPGKRPVYQQRTLGL